LSWPWAALRARLRRWPPARGLTLIDLFAELAVDVV